MSQQRDRPVDQFKFAHTNAISLSHKRKVGEAIAVVFYNLHGVIG
jgi:hypothetical protein